MPKPKSETASEGKCTNEQLYELCYLARDMSAELRSLGLMLGNSYTFDFAISGEDLCGIGIMLKRLSKSAAMIGTRLDEIATPLPS